MSITFFTHCRAFTGEFDQLQERAIKSWKSAVPDCQIILMGDERGTKELAAIIGAVHKPGVPLNEHGTPLVSGIFWLGEMMAANDLLCGISADITLTPALWVALETISEIDKPFVIGQRWDMEPGDTDAAELHSPYAIDYFIYRKRTLGEIPPFAIGRTAYDNWLVWAAMERWGLTVIDATNDIAAVHVSHSYPECGDRAKMLKGAERKENLWLAADSGCDHDGSVTDAPHVLIDGELLFREAA